MKILDKKTLNERLCARIKNDIDCGYIAGACALVMQHGEPVAESVLGLADMERGLSLSADTVFRLASMTKPITAIAALIAEEKRLVEINAPIARYLPEFSEMYVGKIAENGALMRGERAGDMTLLNLLTNTAGFVTGRVGWALDGAIPPSAKRSLQEYVRALGEVMMLDFAPGTAFGYSGRAGFDLVAAAIERTAGVPYEDFVKENITDPLRLLSTTYFPDDEQWSRTALMHDFKDGRAYTTHLLDGKTFNGEYVCGGSGLVSTVREYAVIAQMLLQGGEYGGQRILSKESVRKMSTSAGLPGSWGLGVRTVRNDKHLPCGAYGWSGALGSHFFVDPENKITAVYMKNSYYDGGSEARTARNFEEDIYTSFAPK